MSKQMIPYEIPQLVIPGQAASGVWLISGYGQGDK